MKSWSVKDADDATVAYIKQYAKKHGYKVGGALRAIINEHKILSQKDTNSAKVVSDD